MLEQKPAKPLKRLTFIHGGLSPLFFADLIDSLTSNHTLFHLPNPYTTLINPTITTIKLRKMEYNNIQYPNTFPGYLGNQSSKPFYHTNLQNNLEGISLKVEPQKQKNPLERIFSDKATTSKATVRALLDEIKLRESLDSHLLKTIDDEICSQNTELMGLDNVKANYAPPELAKYMNKRRSHLESNVLELEREKRKEYLECWRDLMFMKKYLLTSLKDYWDLAKKRNLLSYDVSHLLQNENIKRH